MALNNVPPKPISEDGDSTVYTVATPPETLISELDDFDPFTTPTASSVPWPGSTFIIRSASSGHVITLLDGEVVLAPPGGRGSIHWTCVDTKGWIGFRNTVSGRFLGHDKDGKLRCQADRQQGWENFCVRLRPEGRYVLLMTHFERLWNVGIKVERGVDKLAKIDNEKSDGLAWEFVKVEESTDFPSSSTSNRGKARNRTASPPNPFWQ